MFRPIISEIIKYSLCAFIISSASLATDDKDSDSYLSVGLMSGTSMDGIDAALIKTNGIYEIEELGNISLNYVPEYHLLLKTAEYLARTYEGDMQAAHLADFNEAFTKYLTTVLHLDEEEVQERIKQASIYLHDAPGRTLTLDHVIDHSTFLHAQAVEQLLRVKGYSPDQIDVVGYHGQTLFHRPSQKITIQVGKGQELANKLGIVVINDFRSRDVRYGGQGAPFAPLYHQALAIRDHKYPLAVVNCGGIANISLINGKSYEDLIGFDTGPGNGLVDLFVKQRTNFAESMDVSGKYGSQGQANSLVLQALYEKAIESKDGTNYLQKVPPKSLDINDLKLVPELDALSIEDGCATLEAFTADSIVRSIKLLTQPFPQHWVLAGGGWSNPVIYKQLADKVTSEYSSQSKVNLAEEIGWNNKAMEAQIFAYLAVRSLLGLPISVPQTTKVKEPLTGGHAYLPLSSVTHKVKTLLEKNPGVLNGYQG